MQTTQTTTVQSGTTFTQQPPSYVNQSTNVFSNPNIGTFVNGHQINSYYDSFPPSKDGPTDQRNPQRLRDPLSAVATFVKKDCPADVAGLIFNFILPEAQSTFETYFYAKERDSEYNFRDFFQKDGYMDPSTWDKAVRNNEHRAIYKNFCMMRRDS